MLKPTHFYLGSGSKHHVASLYKLFTFLAAFSGSYVYLVDVVMAEKIGLMLTPATCLCKSQTLGSISYLIVMTKTVSTFHIALVTKYTLSPCGIKHFLLRLHAL